MTKLLALDTSGPLCSVALIHNEGRIIRQSAEQRASAQQILPMVREVLMEAKLSLAELDAIAVVSGPGSFTGIRIGVGVAQGLSMANSTPVIPLSSLAVYAMAACRSHQGDNWLVAVNAREREIYAGAYRRDEAGGVELLGRELVCAVDSGDLAELAKLTQQPWNGIGDAWDVYSDAMINALDCPVDDSMSVPDMLIDDLCALAEKRYAQRAFVETEQVLPNYVKEQMDYS